MTREEASKQIKEMMQPGDSFELGGETWFIRGMNPSSIIYGNDIALVVGKVVRTMSRDQLSDLRQYLPLRRFTIAALAGWVECREIDTQEKGLTHPDIVLLDNHGVRVGFVDTDEPVRGVVENGGFKIFAVPECAREWVEEQVKEASA